MQVYIFHLICKNLIYIYKWIIIIYYYYFCYQHYRNRKECYQIWWDFLLRNFEFTSQNLLLILLYFTQKMSIFTITTKSNYSDFWGRNQKLYRSFIYDTFMRHLKNYR